MLAACTNAADFEAALDEQPPIAAGLEADAGELSIAAADVEADIDAPPATTAREPLAIAPTAETRQPLIIAPGAIAGSEAEDEIAAIPVGPTTPTRDEFLAAIRRSEQVGRAMYEKDIAAARATELLLDQGYLADDRRISGWLTERIGDSMQVTYVAEQGDELVVAHRVGFADGMSGVPVIDWTVPAATLAGDRARMYAARETAIKALRPLCDTNYNTVVLPGEVGGEPGWLVYMLAATVQPGRKVLAGHVLVRVSADGSVVDRVTPLSLSCLIVPDELPEGVTSAGIMMTHLTTEWPLETHVYTSLLYDTPVYVQTRAGLWRVSGGKVALAEPAAR